MHIRDEVKEITTRTGDVPRNIEQFTHNKDIIVAVKTQFMLNYNYSPSFSECYHIIYNNLKIPDRCLSKSCQNLAKFANRNRRYMYCSRKCSDTDKQRNKKIQDKRKDSNIDYKKVHEKVVATKNVVGDDGLNVHQRTSLVAMTTRNENYEYWYETTLKGIQNRSPESRIVSSKKREDTLFDRYGVCHFGGGYSNLKNVMLNEKSFMCQGYEDVALYELVFKRHIPVDDIEDCVRFKKHKFNYKDNEGNSKNYYPDIFIKSMNLYIEVKSSYWLSKDTNIELKKNSIIEAGFLYERIIYDKDDIIKEARSYFNRQYI